jgi:DNA-binding transcriptional LysR family regulator
MEMFVRVVETRSFSAAARDLKVGQPAVSKSVAQLEERFGVRLLMRSTRGLTLTEAGQHFYERARRIVDEANEAAVAVSGVNGEFRGSLRVSAGVTIARLHIVPYLHLFLERHPKLSLDLLLSDSTGDPIQDGVDVCFRPGMLTDSSVIARKVATAPRLVVGTPAFFARHGEPVTPRELDALPAVIYSMQRAGGGEAFVFRKGDHEVESRLSGPLRITAAEAVRSAVLNGLGFTIASQWMFAPELSSGEVRAVLSDWQVPPLDYWALFPAGRMVTAKARAFTDFVQCQLARAIAPRDQPPLPRLERRASEAEAIARTAEAPSPCLAP